MKIELDFSNYVTEADLKNATDAGTVKTTKTVQLDSLKSEIDKLDIGKLETTPVNLSKLIGVVKNDVFRKNVYNKLVKNVNAIQASNLGNLIKKADYNTKIAEIYLIMIITISILLLRNFAVSRLNFQYIPGLQITSFVAWILCYPRKALDNFSFSSCLPQILTLLTTFSKKLL